MTIKLKYDPEADRMRLLVEQAQGQPGIFWLRRNQCLALLARLMDVAHEMQVQVSEPTPLKVPAPRPRKDPVIDAAEPEIITGMRLRVQDQIVYLQMGGTEKGAAIRFDATGIKRFHEVVATQAERAGWDPVAGTKRLRAMAQARAAITKSKSAGDGS
jgi:hypothetical protein